MTLVDPVDVATGWLQAIHGRCDGHTVTCAFRNGTNIGTWWAPAGSPAALADPIAEHQHANLYYGVATRTAPLEHNLTGDALACLQIPGMWVDIDIAGPGHKHSNELAANWETARTTINRLGPPPTAVINSGGGLHAYWLYEEPVDANHPDTTLILERWRATWQDIEHDTGHAIDNVWNTARIMRIPGTANHKTDPPTGCHLVETGPRIEPGDLDDHLIDPPPPEHRPEPYTGPTRPGDLYNQDPRTPPTLLEELGFHSPKQRRHRQDWWRPGRTQRDPQSASIWPDGHITIWSDTAAASLGVKPSWGYNPFQLRGLTVAEGDWKRNARELVAAGYQPKHTNNATSDDGDDVDDPTHPSKRLVTIDWPEFWKAERPDREYLVEPLIPTRRQIAVYSPPKVGKSLLGLEIAAAVASGRAVLDRPESDPVPVAYIDLEMSEDDLLERLEDLDYGPGSDLTRFHYFLHPDIGALDTAAGAADLAWILDRYSPELVVVDTVARAVEGPENEADTIRAYTRHGGRILRQRSVTTLRFDHAGKDPTKGQRGSSDKAGDVDVVWRLTRDVETDKLTATATHRRVTWVPEKVEIVVEQEPVRHRLLEHAYASGTKELAEWLDSIGAPVDAGRPALKRDWIEPRSDDVRRLGIATRNAVISDAIRWRRVAGRSRNAAK